MPIYMIMPDNLTIIRFFFICLAVICSPTVIISILREASSETYGPGSIFYHISFRSTISVSYLLSLQSFTFRSINQKYQKHYFTIYPSLSDLTLQITVKGLTTPLSRWVQVVWLFVHVFGDLCVISYWIDTLVLKIEGNTYSTMLHHPFLFKGKTNASSRGSKKDFWRRCWGDLRQVKTYKVSIINSHLLHYIILHSRLIFLSTTSKMIFEKICLFFAFFPYVFFVFPCAFSFLASLLAKNLLIWIHLKYFTWIIFDPYVLVLKPQLV